MCSWQVDPLAELSTEIPCSVCDWKFLKYRSSELDIPYFGKATQTTILCERCGYKHNDILLNELKEPTRYSILIDGVDDLSIKVVRSASATVSVPELGLLVEPGVASEGYISNVEGVLMRFRDAVEQAIRFALNGEDLESAMEENEEKAAQEKGKEILERIDEVIAGGRSVNMILEDPFGNSAIISEKARKEEMSEEEIRGLKTGFNIFEVGR